MELKEKIVDEKNEKIISKVDDIFGCQNNKSVLRKIVNYSKIINESKIEFGNYNILISNKSAYDSYQKLINIILDLYIENGIINNKNTYYATKEDVKFNGLIRNKKEIEESVIVINIEKMNCSLSILKDDITEIIDNYSDKIFIIIGDCRTNDEDIQAYSAYVMWTMKIEKISLKEKIGYTKKFFEDNNLIYDEKILKDIADKPLFTLKNYLVDVLINCKTNDTNIINNDIIKPEKKEKKVGTKISAVKELNNLIGLEETKEQVNKILSYIKLNKKRKNLPMLHMCFNGNPGTGKTTVARIVGKIFAQENILSNDNKFVEAQRADLIGEYVGQTAPKTKEMVDRAKGGVLFIDEAYSIASYIQDEAGRDYGAECIATLIKEMEDNRDNICIIFAGYTKEMEHMLDVNPGFSSRVQFKINFPDYSSEELYEIFKQMCKKEKYKLSTNVKQVLLKQFDIAKQEKNFSNARYVRNIFEKIKMEQAYRVTKNENQDINLIKKCDVEKILLESKLPDLPKFKIGFAS